MEPAVLMMCFAYKLNNQGDNIQPWHTPFPIWNQSVVLCPVLTIASWPAYRFLRRQVRWSGILISLRIFRSLLWSTHSRDLDFSLVNEAEVDVFLEYSCFFYDPVDVGNLISGSSAFSKSSLNMWKFSVHILSSQFKVQKCCIINARSYISRVLEPALDSELKDLL